MKESKPINYAYALGHMSAQMDSETFWRQELREKGYDTWKLPRNLIKDIADIGHASYEASLQQSRGTRV